MKCRTVKVLTKSPAGPQLFLTIHVPGNIALLRLASLLRLLGLGATVATVLASVPWLVTLSHHKSWVFTVAGVLIALNFIQTTP